MDKAIPWINHYPLESALLVSLRLVHWIVIYPADSAIHSSNNWGQDAEQRGTESANKRAAGRRRQGAINEAETEQVVCNV